MAPPIVHEAPHVQLGRLMVRARREGLPFDAFWRRALNEGGATVMVTDETAPAGAVRWPTDGTERGAWMRAIRETRETWERAYLRQPPTRGDEAVAFLADTLGLLADAEVVEVGLGALPASREAAAA